MYWKRILHIFAIAAAVSMAAAEEPPAFTVAWSIYVGWNPYHYMARSGILRKWADKYNVRIRVQRFDYAPSVEAFVAKNVDACTMTNMEALDMPAASGVDSTAIVVGDYSNGNDALLVRHGLSLHDLPGKHIMLVQKTVSEYLFERAFTLNGMQDQIRRVHLVNTSDSDIVTAFLSQDSEEAVVTWKPLVTQIARTRGISTVFDSSKIPGEILDLLVVRTDVLNRPDGSGVRFAKAVTGAWYEVMSQFNHGGALAEKAIAGSAQASNDTVASFREQLATTHLFSTPDSAESFAKSADMKAKMDLVRRFCFAHGLLGEGTASADDVAILYPDGSIQGRKDRVRLRFDAKYMALAQGGKL